MGCGETAIGVDTVSPGMIRNRATVDSGGNAGLPERQALHTQASSATLLQHPTHPGRWMPPGICLPFLFPRLSDNRLGIMGIRPVIGFLQGASVADGALWSDAMTSTSKVASNTPASRAKAAGRYKFNGIKSRRDAGATPGNGKPKATTARIQNAGRAATESKPEFDKIVASDYRMVLTRTVEPPATKRVELRHEYFLPNIARRACFREWRKGYNAAT